MKAWVMVVLLLQIGDLSTLGKHPYRIDYQVQDLKDDTPGSIRGTLWVLGSLCKSLKVYPDGVTQVDLYDGSQWWLYLSDAPEITPLDRPPLRSVLEFFTGGEVPILAESSTSLEIPQKNGKLVVKGIRRIAGLGPVPETVIFVDTQGNPVWKLKVTSIKEAPEITESFFQKSTLPAPKTSELKARDKEKNPVWDY